MLAFVDVRFWNRFPTPELVSVVFYGLKFTPVDVALLFFWVLKLSTVMAAVASFKLIPADGAAGLQLDLVPMSYSKLTWLLLFRLLNTLYYVRETASESAPFGVKIFVIMSWEPYPRAYLAAFIFLFVFAIYSDSLLI